MNQHLKSTSENEESLIQWLGTFSPELGPQCKLTCLTQLSDNLLSQIAGLVCQSNGDIVTAINTLYLAEFNPPTPPLSGYCHRDILICLLYYVQNSGPSIYTARVPDSARRVA
jgi:hypothetical protein